MSNTLYVDKKSVGFAAGFNIVLPEITRIVVSRELFDSQMVAAGEYEGAPVLMKGQVVGTIKDYSPAQVELYINPEFFEFSIMKPVLIDMRYIGPESVVPIVDEDDLINQLLEVPDTALARDF